LHLRLEGGQVGLGNIRGNTRFEFGDAPPQFARFGDLAEDLADLVGREWFGQVIRRPGAHGFDGGFE
jgi:hypothetical protein